MFQKLFVIKVKVIFKKVNKNTFHLRYQSNEGFYFLLKRQINDFLRYYSSNFSTGFFSSVVIIKFPENFLCFIFIQIKYKIELYILFNK